MSLTSYRAAPPRVGWWWGCGRAGAATWLRVVVMRGGGGRWTWRRPTLPRLGTQYHGRFGVSRPSSEWGRVGHPRYRPPGRRTTPFARTSPAGRGRGRWLGKSWHGRSVPGRGMRLSLAGVEVDRAIRTGQLHASPRVHTRPIDVVVYHGPDGETWFCGRFPA
jgi:hypothetical protein